jgi:non-ribosomal peptide synthetase component F
MGVLLREMGEWYGAVVNGGVAEMGELGLQYGDYAQWQREWLVGEVLAEQLEYWRARLQGAPAELELATARPRPPVQSLNGVRHRFRLSEELTEGLQRLSRQHGATLFMTLLAAFQVLLSRYTGQLDIVVGTGIANRNRAEMENLIGFFVNMLALRTDLSGNPPFRELLRRVREVTLDAYAHQDLPFDKLVEELQPTRDLRRSPIFQAVLVLQNAPMTEVRFPGLTLTPLTFDKGPTHFDLTLTLEHQHGGLAGLLEYNADIYDADIMAKMMEHFRILLEHFAAHPETRLLEVPLSAGPERQPRRNVNLPEMYEGDQFIFELD